MINHLKLKLSDLDKENENHKSDFERLSGQIKDLEVSNKKVNEIADKFHKELIETKRKFKKDNAAMVKQHKAEVKSWRLDLGEEMRLNIKLEEKLKHIVDNGSDSSIPEIDDISNGSFGASELFTSSQSEKETCCSICSIVIKDYSPQYFLKEIVNPACDTCKDHSLHSDDELTPETLKPFTPKGFNHRPSKTSYSSSPSVCTHTKQCIIREPFSPPLPSLMPLVNLSSQYHLKTMAGELDWGSTCSYCFRIEYEKYGCDSCVWIKCFGERHGYPDVNPYDYKKHLE